MVPSAKLRSALMLLLLILLRLAAALVLAFDLGLLAMLVYHWNAGGLEGVKAWIIHTHASFGGHRWEEPVDQLVRESYREFATVVAFLVAATTVLLLGERRVTRLSKPGGGCSAVTTR